MLEMVIAISLESIHNTVSVRGCTNLHIYIRICNSFSEIIITFTGFFQEGSPCLCPVFGHGTGRGYDFW